MGKAHAPRHGSMQFWPHRRAQKEACVVKNYPAIKDPIPLGFAGYKVGMTHAQFVDTYKNSHMKGEVVSVPVTIIECPPIKIVGIRTYTTKYYSKQPFTQILAEKLPKHLERAMSVPKQPGKKAEELTADKIIEVHLLCAMQPSMTGIGKKKPEVFEMAIGGPVDAQLKFAKENLGKDIAITDVFKVGESVDVHAVTKGKGFSGTHARFGIRSTQHKSEKGTRTVGSLGAWCGQGHMMYRVPHPGKHGYYTRVTFNQQIMLIGNSPDAINAKGGFVHYGNVKSSYILVKGSIHGPAKRLIRFIKPMRPQPNKGKPVPQVDYVYTGSHQA